MSHSYQLLEMNTTNGGMQRGSKDVEGNIHHLKYTKITKRRISTIAVMKEDCQSHQLKQFIIQGHAYPLNTYMSTIFHTEQLKSHGRNNTRSTQGQKWQPTSYEALCDCEVKQMHLSFIASDSLPYSLNLYSSCLKVGGTFPSL